MLETASDRMDGTEGSKRVELPDTSSSIRVLGHILRSGVPGRHKAIVAAAMVFPQLKRFPLPIGAVKVFVDLRDPDARDLLMQAPSTPESVFADDWLVFRRCISAHSHVIDIGANYGVFAAAILPLLSAGGSITCFEPHRLLQSQLCRLSESSGDVPIAVVGEALSDNCGVARFFEGKGSSNSSLGNWKAIERNEQMVSSECNTITLDAWIESKSAQQPAFIKCDVEGSELLVFRGARGVLDRKDAPVVYFEQNIHTVRGLGIRQFAAAEFLLSLDRPRFQLFQATRNGQLTAFAFEPTNHVNLFAIPEHQARNLTCS